MSTKKRKDEHIDICLNEAVDQQENFFDCIDLPHNALPEIDFAEIGTSTEFLGKKISAPLVISSMTGGGKKAQKINERLARGAEKMQVPLGLGSCRVLLEDESTLPSFQMRAYAPTTAILANLGAIQLNNGVSPDDCKKIIDLTGANALCLHLNPLQEVIQDEGDTNFSGLLKKIEAVVKTIDVRIIVKEVGMGISGKVAQKLFNVGVQIVDVAGRGGTSWSYIEGKRNADDSLGDLFANWGTPTPEAIHECSQIDGLTVIASGGIRSGLDIAKALYLGADYAAMALPFLKAAEDSQQAVEDLIKRTTHELKIAMFGIGKKTL